MPCVKIERWICERCRTATDAPETEHGSGEYATPRGWTFADLSPVFEGPICPSCIESLKRWSADSKRRRT